MKWNGKKSIITIGQLAACVLLVGSCKLQTNLAGTSSTTSSSNQPQANGNSNSNSSQGATSSGNPDSKWEGSSSYKRALEHRPNGHPQGKPWFEPWRDSSTRSNDALPIDVQCDAAKENDICNGLDDDCNGKIDENCGMKTGGLQVAIAWEDSAEVDLEVIYTPWDGSGGGTITYKSQNMYDPPKPTMALGTTRTAPTLALQENALGSCACKPLYTRDGTRRVESCGEGCSSKADQCWADDAKQYAENAFLDSDEVPPGIYELKFYVNNTCGKAKDTRVNLSVAYKGETLGAYRSGDLNPQGFSFPIVKLFVP